MGYTTIEVIVPIAAGSMALVYGRVAFRTPFVVKRPLHPRLQMATVSKFPPIAPVQQRRHQVRKYPTTAII